MNNGLALASQVVREPTNQPGRSQWMPSVSVKGRMYHMVGPLAPDDGVAPQFAQLYVHDPNMAADLEAQRRLEGLTLPGNTSHAQQTRLLFLLRNLQAVLRRSNSYVSDYVMAAELFRTEAMDDARLVLDRNARPTDATSSQYDAPTTGRRHAFQEVTVIMGENTGADDQTGIVLRHRHAHDGLRWSWHPTQPSRTRLLRCSPLSSALEHAQYVTRNGRTTATLSAAAIEGIDFDLGQLASDHAVPLDEGFCTPLGSLDFVHYAHRSVDPLHFVLLFPCGDDGWHQDIARNHRPHDDMTQQRATRSPPAQLAPAEPPERVSPDLSPPAQPAPVERHGRISPDLSPHQTVEQQREWVGFAHSDAGIHSSWLVPVAAGDSLQWGRRTYLWNAAVPHNAERGPGARRSWFLCNAITHALGQRQVGWLFMYPYIPDDFVAEYPFLTGLAWSTLVRLLHEAFHSLHLSVVQVAQHMDGRLHWPADFQERLVHTAEPLFARDRGGGMPLATLIEAWCMQLMDRQAALADGALPQLDGGVHEPPRRRQRLEDGRANIPDPPTGPPAADTRTHNTARHQVREDEYDDVWIPADNCEGAPCGDDDEYCGACQAKWDSLCAFCCRVHEPVLPFTSLFPCPLSSSLPHSFAPPCLSSNHTYVSPSPPTPPAVHRSSAATCAEECVRTRVLCVPSAGTPPV